MEESHSEYFKVKSELVKMQLNGSDEGFQDESDGDVDKVLRERMRLMKLQDKLKQDRLAEIASRHITEFANE